MEQKQILKQLLNVGKELEKQRIRAEGIIDSEFLGAGMDELIELTLDVAGLPKDNSLTKEKNAPDLFIRDYWFSLVMEYHSGERTANDVIDKLLQWQSSWESGKVED